MVAKVPLHYFESHGSVEDVMRFVDRFPWSVSIANNDERLLLHHAVCGRYEAARIVEFLLKKLPEGINTSDSRCRLPLYQACQSIGVGSGPIIRRMVEMYPFLVMKMTNCGRSPLQLLAQALMVTAIHTKSYTSSKSSARQYKPWRTVSSRSQIISLLYQIWLCRSFGRLQSLTCGILFVDERASNFVW
jgi:hypothetical protein